MRGGIFILIPLFFMVQCTRQPNPLPEKPKVAPDSTRAINNTLKSAPDYVIVTKNVTLKHYFEFLDSTIKKHQKLQKSTLAEYLLVLNNAWIIDSLRALDYYTQKSKGKFQYDLAEETILHMGDTLFIPNQHRIDSIIKRLKATRIDVNIPEFRLRIIQYQDTVFTCKVRVGRDNEEYLESVGRMVDQRTPIGRGRIIKVVKQPLYYDLHSGEKYEETKRDDGRYTRMPMIPSLEPIINETRNGTMFHATTNKKTLGKAYSNGCVGLREADMWTLYYHAPVGTHITLRYDLKVAVHRNDTITLKDIYHMKDIL